MSEDQAAVIDFLSAPSTHGGAAVERVDTHISIVFLTGARAWKLKRAVSFDYLDFSTPERRRTCCEAEVRLNRRTAPGLYRGVVPVTRERDGSLALGGGGTPVDWVVEMNPFDQAALFDRLAERGALDLDLMMPLASAIARLHRDAAARPDHGGAAGMRWVIDGNAAGFAEYGPGTLEPSACYRVTDDACGELDRRESLLDERRESGFVRQCHGDLHLRNVVLYNDVPTLFDAIEFNDEIACVDVLYDLAFLLMDLWHRGLRRHANAVWNGYLAAAGGYDGLSLLPLFLSCRAAVRAKTSATSARVQTDAARSGELQQIAREYLDLAERLLHPPKPCLIAIGGFSGTGKSTLALALAPSLGAAPGAVVLRSDEIRKRLLGLSPFERLEAGGYTAEISDRVYAALAAHAATVVGQGHSAIVDAVCARPAQRQALERVAADARVPFAGLWLEAPETVLLDRVAQRRRDASDADAGVVRLQAAQDAGAMTWRRMDATAVADALLREAAGAVEAQVAQAVAQ